jgi:hypothetical protein
MNNYKSLLVSGLFLIATFSCVKIQTLPPEPYVEFTSFKVFDTVDILGNTAKGGTLKFYFEDGDGDLGLPPPATGQTYDTTNLFLTLYRKAGGVMVPAPENDPLKPSDYRIPYMERLGQNKILKGYISVTFLYLFYSESDTIRYDFYIKDRALNVSNIASTSEIALFVNDLYEK